MSLIAIGRIVRMEPNVKDETRAASVLTTRIYEKCGAVPGHAN